jgi:UDP-N-acetylmuramate--alanine ligase
MIGKDTAIYFLGIGGIGMSALAKYFSSKGYIVCGYDKTPGFITDVLSSEGIVITFNDTLEGLPETIANAGKSNSLVIYTPAIPESHPQYRYFRDNNWRMEKRAYVLAQLSNNYYSIAVAGTHGKTTTSTLLSHLLIQLNKSVTAFLGGISANYQSNYLTHNGDSLTTHAQTFVVEADEFDRSFHQLNPDVAIVTSADADHLDIYGTKESLTEAFEIFITKIKSGGRLLIKKGLALNIPEHIKSYTYSVTEEADFKASNIRIVNSSFYFDYHGLHGVVENIRCGLPGIHNLENALAAMAVCEMHDLDMQLVKEAVNSFSGVKRRFEKIIEEKDFVFIDDYAHHPEELKACITSARMLYPEKRLLGVFQPHLFSRTRDFANGFAQSLSLLDELMLLDIYPAREEPIPGVTSALLLDAVTLSVKKLIPFNQLVDAVYRKKNYAVLTLGAGSIDQLVEPLKNKFLNDEN